MSLAIGMRMAALFAVTMALAKGMVRYLVWRGDLLGRVRDLGGEPKPRTAHSLES